MTNELEKTPYQPSEQVIDDLYDRLSIPRSANPAVIKKAYHELARFYHPDNKETGNRKMFEAIQEAYDILINPVTREEYDRTGGADRTKIDDPVEIEAREQCSVIMSNIINEEQEPEYSPIFDKLARVFSVMDSQIDKKRHDLDNRERKIIALRKRLKRKKEASRARSPILIMMLDHQAKQIVVDREKLSHMRKVHDRVKEIFGEYVYEHSTRAPQPTTFEEMQAILNSNPRNFRFTYRGTTHD